MGRGKLVPGGRPPSKSLDPVEGEDGIWRLDRIRHRRFNGTYTRTSASGYSRDDCLEEWELAFEKKRREGTARRASRRHRFALTDPMSVAFKKLFEATSKRVEKGKITQQTYDLYHYVTYKGEGPRANPDSIRLETEMGALSIAEVGQPVYLSEYLEDVGNEVPGIAALQQVVLKDTFKMLTIAGLFEVSPMALIDYPEQAEPNQRALDPVERDRLYCLVCTRNRRVRWFRMLYLLLLGTGIRPGEAYALWWSDCPDLDDDTIDKAVLRVGATMVRSVFGSVFRQNKRKHCKVGVAYYITLPRWLTAELRAYKDLCKPQSPDSPILLSLKGTMIRSDSANRNLAHAKDGSDLDWVTWGNLRDTVATHIAGRSGDPRNASAQLGHVEGAAMATTNYIDPRGYVHPVVDNSVYLEELVPNVGGMLEALGDIGVLVGTLNGSTSSD